MKLNLKHKWKYHIPTQITIPTILKYITLAIFIFIIISQTSSAAYTLDSSGVTPTKIFKCQPAIISGNFTGAILSIKVWVNSSVPVVQNGLFQTEQKEVTAYHGDGSYWSAVYGNDNTTLWGNKTITFSVTTGDGIFYNTTNLSIFVYSDACTGTGITNYTQIDTGFRGFGTYTSKLWSDSDYTLIDLSLEPWVDYWGYFYYIIIITFVATSTYQKSQNIWQPIIVTFTGLSALVGTTAIPPEFRQYIVVLLGTAFGVIIYRLTMGKR